MSDISGNNCNCWEAESLAEQVATLTAERDALQTEARRLERAHEKRHDELTNAWAEIDGLKADLSARMSQLNEARAATVDCNMALMEMAGAVATEREACAQVANNFRRANRTGNAIAAAIRNRGNE